MRHFIPLVVSAYIMSSAVHAVDVIVATGDQLRKDLPALYEAHPSAKRLVNLEFPSGAKVDDVVRFLVRDGDPAVLNEMGNDAVLKAPLRVKDMEMPLVVAWIAFLAEGSVAVDGQLRLVVSKIERTNVGEPAMPLIPSSK